MIERELDDFLKKKAFRSVAVNAAGIRVYYRTEEGVCYLLILYSFFSSAALTKEQQQNVGRQVRERFLQAGFERLCLLNLVETDRPQEANALFDRQERFWILDAANGRLMLYEDQEGDFCGLRKPLEELAFAAAGAKRPPDAAFDAGPRGRKAGRANGAQGEWREYLSPANTLILLINAVVFFLCEWFGSTQDTAFLLAHGGLSAKNVLEQREYYRLLTYMFLHGGMDHILNNMLILLYIGNRLERTVGWIRYLLIYFGSGILAGIVSMSYNVSIDQYVVCVGASGAIFGAVGALAAIILVNRGRVENLTTRQIILFIALSLYGGFISRGTDNAAHIGGLAAGFVLALILCRPKAKGRKGGHRPVES